MGAAVLLQSAALAGAAAGLWLLHAAWRKRSGNGARLAGGWALLLGSTLAWAATIHPDKGSAMGITAITLFAVAMIAATALRAPRRAERATSSRDPAPAASTGGVQVARNLFGGFLAGPVCGASALSLSTAAFVGLHRIGTEPTANLVLCMFAFPLLWASLAVLVSADRLLWRKSLVALGLGLLPFAWLVMAS